MPSERWQIVWWGFQFWGWSCGRWRPEGGMAKIYRWGYQVGPLEIRRWA